MKVRVLYDWFGCLDVRRSFWREMREAGVDVRCRQPANLRWPAGGYSARPPQVARRGRRVRLHGRRVHLRGWLVTSPETGLPYRDTAVGIRGPAVAEAERAFAGLWGVTGEALPERNALIPRNIPRAGEESARVVVQEPRRMRTFGCCSCSPRV